MVTAMKAQAQGRIFIGVNLADSLTSTGEDCESDEPAPA